MTGFTKVANLTDLPPGRSLCVDVAGEKVALFNVDGTVHAISDTCTHRGGPLSAGEVDGTTVTCPWHGATFDLSTGNACGPPASTSVKRYSVSVKGSDILLGGVLNGERRPSA